MVTFNELRFSDDLASLSVDIELNDVGSGEDNEGYYISAVHLEHYTTRVATGALSDSAVAVYENDNDDDTVTTLSLTGDDAIDESVVRGAFDNVDGFEGELFYVVVTVKKMTGAETYVTSNELGAVIDWRKVYDVCMGAVNAFNALYGSCVIPMELETDILVYHSLRMAMDAGDADQLDLLWPRFVGKDLSQSGSSCNCG